MDTFTIINDIRQNYDQLTQVNPNATFQKNKKSETKMIRRNGKTDLFETPAFSTPLNLQTDAQTTLQPIQISQINTTLKNNIQKSIQTPIQTPRITGSNIRNYTYEELTAKGMLKPKLQEILKDRGLKISGNKDQLIERILQSQV